MPVSQNNKILFVCNSSWGVLKFRIHTINALIEEGYEITVLAPEDKYSKELVADNRISFIRLKNLHPSGLSPIQDLQLYREFKNHYAKIQPDLIIHYTIKPNVYGSRAASKLGIPSISVITGLGNAFINRPFLSAIASFLYKRSLHFATETWFLNPDDRNHFVSRSIINTDKTFILPGEGVDTEKFKPAASKVFKSPMHFLLIGRLIKEKGIIEFAEAARLLRNEGLNCRFSILGFSDPENPSSISLEKINHWKKNSLVNYIGSSDDVRPYITEADCIVLPSYREGMPLSLLEGSSMAKPIIASDTPGCREIIRDGVNGFICNPADAVSLAQAMKKMLNLSHAEREQLGNNGRNIVLNQFNSEIIKNIYLQKIRAINH